MSDTKSSSDLLARIGGEEKVDEIVIKWYEFLTRDDMVGKYFMHHKTDLEKLQKMQKKFLVHIFDGSMRQAHSKLHLKDKHFDRVKELLGKTMVFYKFPVDIVQKVLELAETTRNDILGRDEPMKPAELFIKIGGEKTIDAAVDVFYDKIESDKLLCPFFTQRNMSIQRKMQKSYIRHLLSGSPYNGRSLKATHAKYEIHHEHMDHAKEILGLSFIEVGVEPQYVEEILMTLEPSRKDIVTVNEMDQLAARMEESAL